MSQFPTPPTAPSLSDPANFDTRTDAFLAWMTTIAAQWNSTEPYIQGDAAIFASVSTTGDATVGGTLYVGDGTSNAAKLHINSGGANLVALFESTDAGATVTLIDSATTGGSAAEHGLNTVGDELEIRAVDSLSFETGGVEVAKITNGGQVLVGKTSAGSNVVGVELEPVGSVFATRVSNAAGVFGRNTTDGSAILLRREGNQVGSISVTGSATAFNTSSDYRLKENIAPIHGAGDIIKAMNPVTYTFKSDGSWHDGFLAHELQGLHPRAVIGEKDAVDADGMPEYQGVDYSKLTPILTAALQEALNKIDALEDRLAALEAV